MRIWWLLAVILLAILAATQVQFKSDPTLFLPAAKNAEQANFLTVIKSSLTAAENTANSPLMLAVEIPKTTSEADFAALSQQIKIQLAGLATVKKVINQPTEFVEFNQQTSELFAGRYLLSSVDWQALPQQLESLWQAWQWGEIDRELALQDPVFGWQKYLQQTSLQAENFQHQSVLVYQDQQQTQLLFLLYPTSNDFGQLQQDLSQLTAALNLPMLWSSAEFIGWQTKTQIEQKMQWISLLSAGLILLFLSLSLRQPGLVAWVFVPLISATAIGAWLVSWLFGGINPITLALGMVLLGVAIDYPIHILFRKTNDNQAWLGVRLALITTLLGYLGLLLVESRGIQQLAVFASVGLLTSLLIIKLMVRLDLKITAKTSRFNAARLHPGWQLFGWILAAGLLATSTFKSVNWQDDLAALSPVSAQSLALDGKLRSWLGQTQVDQMLLISAENEQQLFNKLQRTQTELEQLQAKGLVAGSFSILNWLPAGETQLQNQQAIPTEQQIKDLINQQTSPLNSIRLAKFIDNLNQAKSMSVIDLKDFKNQAFDWQLELLPKLLIEQDSQFIAQILLIDVQDKTELEKLAAKMQINYFEQRSFIQQKTQELRQDLIKVFAGLVLLFIVGLAITYREIKPVIMIGFGVVLAAAISLAVLNLLNISFSVFHLIGLILAMAMGIDYGVFARQAAKLKTGLASIHAALLTSLIGFGLLLFTDIALLVALGQTLITGIIAMYLTFRLVYRV